MNILKVSKGFPYVISMLSVATASSVKKENVMFFFRKWISTTRKIRIRQ